MAQTTPPTIDPVPTPPIQRGDRATFSSRVDAFILWLVTAVTQFRNVALNVYNNAVDAYNNAVSAANSAAAALASANGASVASGVAKWVSGTTYQAGDVRYSPIDFRTYRRKTTGAGTTDPSLDSNWQIISFGAFPLFYARDEKPSATNGGQRTVSNSFNQVRTLNSVKTNTLGATLSANVFTLPAGTYRIRAYAPAPGPSKLALYNESDASFVMYGVSTAGDGNVNLPVTATLKGEFNIAAQKNFTLRQWLGRGTINEFDLGASIGSGQPEVYSEVWIEKVS